jgi:hypothetical protein
MGAVSSNVVRFYVSPFVEAAIRLRARFSTWWRRQCFLSRRASINPRLLLSPPLEVIVIECLYETKKPRTQEEARRRLCTLPPIVKRRSRSWGFDRSGRVAMAGQIA